MNIDFTKGNGLVPVIIQDNITLVTFFSRSKNRLWTKGEESGNFLEVLDVKIDCDNDTILIKAKPAGPTCHSGSTSCFKEETSKGFVYDLEATINQRINDNDENSYTNKLYRRGINKVAQKVGEEAVELVIEAKDNDNDLFKNEAADLLYHYLILLKMKDFTFTDIEDVLKKRKKSR
jgi:phosphoribosyl-ATP pyrophosphohydrolase/phosphoribosyl-AMP cyclohydrolase